MARIDDRRERSVARRKRHAAQDVAKVGGREEEDDDRLAVSVAKGQINDSVAVHVAERGDGRDASDGGRVGRRAKVDRPVAGGRAVALEERQDAVRAKRQRKVANVVVVHVAKRCNGPPTAIAPKSVDESVTMLGGARTLSIRKKIVTSWRTADATATSP